MTKRQVNIRASDATRAKLAALKEKYGTVAEVVAVAVDRLYQSEVTRHQAPPQGGEGEE